MRAAGTADFIKLPKPPADTANVAAFLRAPALMIFQHLRSGLMFRLRRETGVANTRKPPSPMEERMSERLPRIQPEFIVIIASAWMNESWHGIHYSFDGARFNNRSDAIMHGWKSCGSDDFNIGQTYGDDLIWFGWMSERIDEPDDTMRHIANDCGLTFNPKWARLDLSKVTGAVIGWRTPAPPTDPRP